jgi:hypothetical protein
MDMLVSNTGLMGWVDYLPVYVDNSATDAWAITATGFIPYAASGGGGAAIPDFYLNLSNASNATILDAQGKGTVTSDIGGVIAGGISVSRLSGVAPLYVNFDYTGTTSSASANPAHECFFATDFGDSGAGVWANGVQSSGLTSKNAGYGPVTGHVYETPGTYHPQVVAIDGAGNISSRTATITVQDPNVVYAGALTICISHSGNFTGAPAGATQIDTAGNTDMYAALNGIADKNNKRILFCKADNWTVSASIQFTSITGMTVGGYGTGVARAFGSGTLVNVDASLATTGSVFLTNAGCSDIRLCDMKVLGGPQSVSGISLLNTITQFTASKMEFRGVVGGFNAFPGIGGTNNVFDQHCIYECVTDDLYGYTGVDLYSVSASGAIGTPGVFTAPGHQFKVGNVVQLTGTPPAPLATGTNYYVSSNSLTANTFTLNVFAAGAGLVPAITGTALALSGTGTCTVAKQGAGGGIGAFVGLVRGGMMGCYFDSKGRGEQTVRFPFLDRAHINNNYFARPNQGKNIVKIHSFVYRQVPLHSEKFTLSANVMDMRGDLSYGAPLGYTSAGGSTTVTQVGDTSIAIGNGGSLGDERVRNCIVENNITYGCLGNPKSSRSFVGVGGPNMTIRNNIADFSVGDRTTSYTSPYTYTHMAMGSIGSTTNDPTVGVRFYNNTLYSNLYNAENASFVNFNGIGTGPTATAAIGTPGIFTKTNHYLGVGFRVQLKGTPPAPLATGTFYWVTATSFTANTFTLSATEGGPSLALSGTGTCEVSQFVEVDDVKIQNNIWYYPFHNPANGNKTAYRLNGTPAAAPTGLTVSNNTDNNGGISANPGFVVTPPVALADWKPSGYPVNNGTAVPVLRDFNNASRVGGTYDLGAVLP